MRKPHSDDAGGLVREAHGRDQPPAFTLVELLTVIAIISVLAALLAPSLKKTRDLARGMQCMSNLRQFGIASHVYAQDHDDFLIPCYAPSDPYDNWKACMNAAGIRWAGWDINNSSPVFICPSSPCKTDSTPSTYSRCNYGYSYWLGYANDMRYRYSQFSVPSNKPQICDSGYRMTDVDGTAVCYSYQYFDRATNTMMGFWHNGGANILFFDGHVGWYKPMDVPESPSWHIPPLD